MLEQSGRNPENSRTGQLKRSGIRLGAAGAVSIEYRRENQRQRGAVAHAARRLQRKAAPGPKAAPE
jgi:hypothetical protein